MVRTPQVRAYVQCDVLIALLQGENAVMKKVPETGCSLRTHHFAAVQAIVSNANFQIVHEAQVLRILDREYHRSGICSDRLTGGAVTADSGGLGRDHLPHLIEFHEPAIMVMSHCGQDLGDYQMASVARLKCTSGWTMIDS